MGATHRTVALLVPLSRKDVPNRLLGHCARFVVRHPLKRSAGPGIEAHESSPQAMTCRLSAWFGASVPSVPGQAIPAIRANDQYLRREALFTEKVPGTPCCREFDVCFC